MQTLNVLQVEDGAIIVASPAGERFRLPVDAALRARLTSAVTIAEERRLTPREIQAHVRSGLTAEQVAAMTGTPVAYIERFVGPVLAERAYVVQSALAVRLPAEIDGARSRTFGAVMSERLAALAARDVRWGSAKEPSGWVLSVDFSADEVQHAARWRFDAKHMRLEPDNVEASTISQQGVPAALTPRLRAIEPTAPVAVVSPTATAPSPDTSRFDSAAFHLPPIEQGRPTAGEGVPRPARIAALAEVETTPLTVPRAPGSDDTDQIFAPRPAQVPPRATAPVTPFRPRSDAARSAEPLRRRRERPRDESPPAGADSGGSGDADPKAEDTAPVEPNPPATRPRRGRTSMPSWDEIVFGRDES